MATRWIVRLNPAVIFFTERLGSGDGERKTLLTRQITFEPLPASVLFAFVGVVSIHCCGRTGATKEAKGALSC